MCQHWWWLITWFKLRKQFSLVQTSWKWGCLQKIICGSPQFFWGGDCFKHCDKVIVRIWTIETGVQSNRRHMGPLCSKRTNHSGSHKIPTANPTKKPPSSATMNRKLIKCSGCPVNFFRNSGSCTRKFPKKCAGKYRECLVDHSRHLYIYINMSELNLYIVITSSDYCACHREKERERDCN